MKKNLMIFSCFLMVASSTVSAENLGSFGRTWVIQEINFMGWLQDHLKSRVQDGSWARLQKDFQKRVEKSVDRPMPVGGITPARSARHWKYDPSITVPYDLTDSAGRVFASAGTTVNPLRQIAWHQRLVFLDGDQPGQMEWFLRRQIQKNALIADRPVLVKGSIVEAQKKLNQRVWFDQGGNLTHKFSIECTPAVVQQAGDMLEIEEVVVR